MRKLLGASLLAVLAPSLVGCVTPGGFARGPSPAEISAADPTTSCFNRLAEDPYIITNLADKTGAGRPGDPSLRMLADKSKPTEEERNAISSYVAARQSCIQLGVAYRRANMPPQVWNTLEQGGQRVTALYARLYAGDLTYGEFNTLRMENSSEMKGRLIDGDAQRAQAAAQEDDRRRAAVGQALQNMQNQQMINQQQMNSNRMRQTNCTRIGNQTNCTTY